MAIVGMPAAVVAGYWSSCSGPAQSMLMATVAFGCTVGSETRLSCRCDSSGIAIIETSVPLSSQPASCLAEPIRTRAARTPRSTSSSPPAECSRERIRHTNSGADNCRWRKAVEQALEEKRHLIVEAGTGTGKTLAYLVPVIRSGKRVIISTGTKNLQEQLFYKDVPFLEQALYRRCVGLATFGLLHEGPQQLSVPQKALRS